MVIPDVVDWSFRGCRHLGLRWSCNATIPYNNTKLSTRYMKSWQQLNCVEVALYYCLRQFWVMVLGQNPGILMSTSNKLVNGYMHPPYIWNNPCPYVCLLVLKCLVDGIYTTLQIPPKKWWKSSNYDLKHHFKGYKRRIDSSHFPLCPRSASLTSQISWWLTDEAANDRYDGSYEAGPVSRWNFGWVNLIHKWDITHLLSGVSCQGCFLYIYIYIQRERESYE